MLISEATTNYNLFNLPINPADVQAAVLDTLNNVTGQVIHGVDAARSTDKEVFC